MDQYYEQNVVNHNIDERAKKTKMLTVSKMLCIAMVLFVLMTSMLFISDDSFFFWLAIFSAISLPFAVAAIILGRVNKRNNVEYDYVIDDEYLKITEIYYRQQRKLRYSIRLRLIESVGMFDSDGYARAEGRASKKRLALVNFDNEQAIIYVLYNSDKGRQIIFLEPDRGFIIALRRAVAAVTVFDKSISEFEKRLNEQEYDEYEENYEDEPEDEEESDTEPNDTTSSDEVEKQ